MKTGILGLLLVPFLLIINEFSPPAEKIPEGYSSTIVAFEFVSNEDELKEVLEPLNSEELKNLDRLNYVDFGFMILYGIFWFLFVSTIGQIEENQWLKKGRWLIPVAVLSDALENVQLLKLTDPIALQNGGITDLIFLLGLFTWIKWLLLAIVLSLLGYRFLLSSKFNLTGYLLFVPLALGLVAFAGDSRNFEDLFTTSIFLVFFVLFIYCFIYRSRI